MERRPLLITKILIPQRRPDLVPRPGLISRLTKGLYGAEGAFLRRLTLLSAPAGYGKTTLLTEWAHRSQKQVAWLSVDESDNDVARFLAYLLAALRQPAPEIGEGAEALLGATRSVPAEQVLISLVNDFAVTAEGQAQQLILILDDYHQITNVAIHELLAFLLENMPARLHLALATRADPPLPLARLRGRRQMIEIRQADLRLTPEQAATFLNEVAGLSLPAADVGALHSRSEGWITGLQMAALALGDVAGDSPAERSARVATFAGSQRYLLDYLLEEVLRRQPAAIQAFLLQTSLLPQLSGPLCDAVLRQEPAGYDLGDGERLPHAQDVLEYLEASNSFIVPLDDQRRWYRYHHLFGDLLSRRVRQAMPERVATVHRRASVWYEEEGLVQIAIEQALAAADYERAAHLLEDAAEEMLMRSEVGMLLGLLEKMPEHLLRERSRLRAYFAGARLLMGEPLERVQPFLGGREAGAELLAFRALSSLLQGQVVESEGFSRQALIDLPQSSRFLRGLVAENLGFVEVLRGNFAGAETAFADAIRLGRESGNLLVAVGGLCNLAGLHITEGRLRQAEAVYEEALELGRGRRGQHLPIAGKALFGLGDLYREQNRLKEAGNYLTEAMELFRQYGEMGLIFAGVSLARVRLVEGNTEAAEALLAEAESQATTMDSSEMDDLLVTVHRIYLWLMQGEVERAEARAVAAALEQVPGGAPQLRELVLSVLARLRLAQGRVEAALDLLQPLLEEVRQRGRRGSEIKLSVPAALALEARGNGEKALDILGHALELAQPEGYMRAFLDEGAMPYGQDALPRLLYTAVERGMQPAYAGRLLSVLADRPPDESPDSGTVPTGALIEPLSERELEVLRLIAAGLSNRAIAEHLVLALSTVKGHTSNIYGKLGVSKRTEAVARSRLLGILEK